MTKAREVGSILKRERDNLLEMQRILYTAVMRPRNALMLTGV